MSFTVIHAPQRSPEWFAARLGRLTGSSAVDISETRKAGRRNLLLRLVLERLTGKSHERDFVSAAMEEGIEREADAFRAYEALTGEMVQRVGFVRHDELMVGCSPDGVIGNFGAVLSIKCRQPAAHYDFLRTGTIPADAMAQMRHEMWVTGALTAEYFSWNPDFDPKLQSRVVTVPRDGVGDHEAAALKFLRDVDVELDAMRTMADTAAVLKATA